MFEELKITAERYTNNPIRKIYYYMVTIVFMLTIILHFADPALLRAHPTPTLPLANCINRIE
jgi:hypothetical protein